MSELEDRITKLEQQMDVAMELLSSREKREVRERSINQALLYGHVAEISKPVEPTRNLYLEGLGELHERLKNRDRSIFSLSWILGR